MNNLDSQSGDQSSNSQRSFDAGTSWNTAAPFHEICFQNWTLLTCGVIIIWIPTSQWVCELQWIQCLISLCTPSTVKECNLRSVMCMWKSAGCNQESVPQYEHGRTESASECRVVEEQKRSNWDIETHVWLSLMACQCPICFGFSFFFFILFCFLVTAFTSPESNT